MIRNQCCRSSTFYTKFPGGPYKFKEISRISRSCRHPVVTPYYSTKSWWLLPWTAGDCWEVLVLCGWGLINRAEIQQPLPKWTNWRGSESSTLETDVYVWRYALLVTHARNDDWGLVVSCVSTDSVSYWKTMQIWNIKLRVQIDCQCLTTVYTAKQLHCYWDSTHNLMTNVHSVFYLQNKNS